MAKGKGALAKSPSGAKKTDRSYQDIQKQYRGLAGKSDAQSRSMRRSLMKEMQQARKQQKAAQPSVPPPVDPYVMPQQGIGQGMQQYMNYMQQQGAFNPGSFQDQMNQAYGDVMKQFEMTTGPQFQREQAEFQQMAAERGLDPNSEAYRSLQQQLNQRQDTARQAAMLQGNQAAQAIQEQAFGQAERQYQMPGQMLQAYAPFYGQMGETARLGQAQTFEGGQAQLTRDWQARQNELDRAANMAIARQGRGGGGLSLEQQKDLATHTAGLNLAGQMAMGGGAAPPPQPGFLENAGVAFFGQLPNAMMGRRS